MDALESSFKVVSMASFIVVLLLNTHRALEVPTCTTEEEDMYMNVDVPEASGHHFFFDDNAVSRAALYHWRIWNTLALHDVDLGYWIKPKSTTWFSKFLLEEYEDERWITIFRMTKRSFLSLASILTPLIQKKDTEYRQAVPVTVQLGCALFKLTQGASLLICSEFFAVGRSIVSIPLRDVVHAINLVLRNEIKWPTRDRIRVIATDFQRLCGLPGVLGAIDGTHFAISKPKFAPSDYYSSSLVAIPFSVKPLWTVQNDFLIYTLECLGRQMILVFFAGFHYFIEANTTTSGREDPLSMDILHICWGIQDSPNALADGSPLAAEEPHCGRASLQQEVKLRACCSGERYRCS